MKHFHFLLFFTLTFLTSEKPFYIRILSSNITFLGDEENITKNSINYENSTMANELSQDIIDIYSTQENKEINPRQTDEELNITQENEIFNSTKEEEINITENDEQKDVLTVNITQEDEEINISQEGVEINISQEDEETNITQEDEEVNITQEEEEIKLAQEDEVINKNMTQGDEENKEKNSTLEKEETTEVKKSKENTINKNDETKTKSKKESNEKDSKETTEKEEGAYILLAYFFIFIIMGIYMMSKTNDDKAATSILRFMFFANNGALIGTIINILIVVDNLLNYTPLIISSIIFAIGAIYFLIKYMNKCNREYAENTYFTGKYLCETWSLPCVVYKNFHLIFKCCEDKTCIVVGDSCCICILYLLEIIIAMIIFLALALSILSFYIFAIIYSFFWLLAKRIYSCQCKKKRNIKNNSGIPRNITNNNITNNLGDVQEVSNSGVEINTDEGNIIKDININIIDIKPKTERKKDNPQKKNILYKSTKLNHDINPVSKNKVVSIPIKKNVNIINNKINPGQIDINDFY